MTPESSQKQNSLTEIKKLIQNQICPDEIHQVKSHVDILKKNLEFYWACKLLNLARDKQHTLREQQEKAPVKEWWQNEAAQDEVWIIQQLALCTYKNEGLPPRKRLNQATIFLEEIGLRSPENVNAETLGLGGAVYKRKWQKFGQLEDLYESLSFYRAAFERNRQQDMGYGGANAAFILDLLANRANSIARRNGTSSSEAQHLQRQAKDLRQQMAEQIPAWLTETSDTTGENQFWPKVTLAEVHYGLQEYEKAGDWLTKADAIHADNWKKQTLFAQFLHIGRLQGLATPKESDHFSDWHPAWQTLALIVGEEYARRAILSGWSKVGLALSGGGFRASFFHLGVMARLAEIDALRGVEALSTVSGGSILGAHYYLEVQNCLQTKQDNEITREDYIEIVRRVQEKFLEGVQTNIKMQTFAGLRDNLNVFFGKNYSRSHRLGEFYESELYQKVADSHANGTPRTMPELLVKPKGESGSNSFKPKFSNWLRQAKVPVMVINSTSLNSGHNWQFTARTMGEPPSSISGEIDNNERYRQIHYEDAPTKDLQNYRLGHAVAASACVPGLFEPLTIAGLYDERTLRLVDGGVHDNQGIAGLLDEGCTRILCSDACGQMGDVTNPSDAPPSVLMRASSILQDRVREAQHQDLRCRLDSRALDGLFFVHTRKELEAAPLDWINCQDPQSPTDTRESLTSYGIDRELQEKIAGIRTDLDAFTEVEAYALMASGYQITKREFELLQAQHRKDGNPGTWGGYDIDANGTDWPFRPLEPLLAMKPGANAQRNDLSLQLHVARKIFFKTWDVSLTYKILTSLALLLVLTGLLGLIWSVRNDVVSTITWGGLLIAIILFGATLFMPMLQWLKPSGQAKSWLIKFAIAGLGCILANIHLYLVDRWFLARGKLDRLLKLKP
ncbi:Patatin-like phospholipase [Nitrosomonas marina]|uniref:Patatin-like phospholipase n=1 Tax=Nitrosomonas marina TaxID=917 RepID=A0A1I0F599_9PROT|nr:patatin-like phospholipase family protein [Nitrosomonas marina]SET52596.1 Patatin-like phospholipase [Nitrosomonas marina]